MIEIVTYTTEEGKAPYDDWFAKLGAAAAPRVRAVIARIEDGNLGDVKPAGQGVSERRNPLRSRISHLFRSGWRQVRYLAMRRYQEASVKGH